MPQVAYPSIAEGPLEVSSGLSVHSGVQSASCLRVTGSRNGTGVIWPRDGAGARSGLELAHIPYGQSMIQSYDREHSLWLDLAINAKNISLAPQSGGKVTLPAGTAQALAGNYRGIPNWTVPAANAWYETPIQVSVTATGAVLRLEACGSVYHNTVGAVLYVGFMLDGNYAAMALDSQTAVSWGTAGQVLPYSIIGYYLPTAGPHRISLMLYTTNAAGGAGTWTGAYQTLYVTEQRA